MTAITYSSTVSVPSEKPRIVDERGKTLSAVAGPYEEGSSMSLTCVVSGGRPRPELSWWLDGAEIKSGDGNSVSVGMTKSDGRNGGGMDITTRLLVVQKLNRSQLHTSYTCVANNSNKTAPLMTAVAVEMLLAPLSVMFVNTWQPLSKGKEFTLECQSYGSRPSAKITWWKDNLKLNTSDEQVSSDGNVTTSKLIFTPLISDHDGRLTCRAHNPRLATGVLEQAWKLDVFYLPKVRLELGSKMNPKKIKEGGDVYFECIVDSNPNAYKVIWRHNKAVVANNPKGGVMVTDSALAIQAVGRKNAGNYSCTAYNVEGDGRSNDVHLTVIYKPVCKINYIRTVAVGRNEDIRLSCEVDAYPPATDYQWLLNNTSGTSLELNSGTMDTSPPSSTLIYRPASDADYGSLACKATNIAGVQEHPCLFIVIPAG
uniref:Ig-like domain-containing protein n=1 Tax=Rhodnius prolixus TaxID=13249 RepID=T1HAH0_RHOPR